MSYIEGRYYEDEPLSFSPERQRSLPPGEYRKMRDLVSYSPFSRENEAKIFYLQAKYMENFEDDCPYDREVQYYYPTYQSLSLEELRGYFTWRTRLRHGELTKTSRTYAYLYIYELLHQIGSETKEEGLEKLIWFYEQYRVLEPQIERYAKQWIVDYAVYYDMPAKRVRAYADVDFDEALDALRHCDTVGDEVLFPAIVRLSSYHLEKSKAYRLYPKELMRITCGAYRRLDARYAKRYQKPYARKLWSGPIQTRYTPFHAAVFYEHGQNMSSAGGNASRLGGAAFPLDGSAAPLGVRSVTGEYVDYYEYQLTSERCYIREGNQWREERSYSTPGQSRELGAFTRAADRLVREAYGVRPALKAGDETKTMVKFIEEEIDSSFAKQMIEKSPELEKGRPKVEFDLSLLDDIRKSSDAIGQKLMTEEERGTDPECLANTNRYEYSERGTDASCDAEMEAESAAEQGAQKMMDGSVEGGSLPKLSDDALCFLRLLLYEGDWKGFLSERHMMVSVLAETVNEQLYDEFADVVIEFDGDTPVIVEDYLDDLKGMIPQ